MTNPSTEPVAEISKSFNEAFGTSKQQPQFHYSVSGVGKAALPIGKTLVVPQSVALHYKALAVELAAAMLQVVKSGQWTKYRLALLARPEIAALLNETNETEQQGGERLTSSANLL